MEGQTMHGALQAGRWQVRFPRSHSPPGNRFPGVRDRGWNGQSSDRRRMRRSNPPLSGSCQGHSRYAAPPHCCLGCTPPLAWPGNLDHPGGTRVGIVNGVEQVLLNVVLLQIDHWGVLVACAGGHVENQHLLHAVETAPAGPRQALAQELRHSTQPLQYLKATPRNAGGPASFAHRVVRFHHHAANAPVRQAECGGQPYRASAYDKHLVTFGFVADLVKRWQGWLEAPVFEGSNFFKWHLRPAQIHRLAGRIVLAWQCENVIINQDMKTRNETDRASKAGS